MQVAYESGQSSVAGDIGATDISWGPRAAAVSVYGDPANAAASLFIAMQDGSGHTAVVPAIGSGAAVTKAEWSDVMVSLDDVATAGADLSDIVKVAVGVDATGAGAITVDNVRVAKPTTHVTRNWPITIPLGKSSMTLTGTDAQLTDHVIVPGEVFTLTLKVRVSDGIVWDGKNITAVIYYDDNGTIVPVASKTGPCAGGWKSYTVTFNSANKMAAAGKRIGVAFINEQNAIVKPTQNWLALSSIKLISK
jgi:hypothetical protein